MAEQSYDPIVPMKVGNRRAPERGGHGTPLEGRGKQAYVSAERRHNGAQTSRKYVHRHQQNS